MDVVQARYVSNILPILKSRLIQHFIIIEHPVGIFQAGVMFVFFR